VVTVGTSAVLSLTGAATLDTTDVSGPGTLATSGTTGWARTRSTSARA
jgi:hypothetical protein